MTAASAAEQRWIGGRRFDLLFFFASPALACVAGLLALAAPAAALPLWVAWLWLVEGPHLLATWQRTYLDRDEWSRRPRLLLGSLALFLPGVALLALSEATGERLVFDAYLGAAALWSFHHGVRQHYGILTVYQRLDGTPERAWRADGRLLHAVMWGGFAVWVGLHPANRRLFGVGEAGLAETLLGAVGVAAIVIVLAVWARELVRRRRDGVSLRPAAFLTAVLGSALFALAVIGPFEPIHPGASTPESLFLAVTVVGGTVHGVQYLGIVIAASKRRHPAGGGVAGSLARAPAAAYVAMIVVSLGYLALNAARGAAPPFVVADPDGLTARAFLAVYWGLFFHHYYLDSQIWHPGRDPRVARDLGLTR
jgi:hypothetical protein